ncbi:MAG: TonB-dependent receptor, partial [Longimicrobiales bacterium]
MLSRVVRLALALALGGLLVAFPLAAQQGATTGTFRGRVMGAENQPVVAGQVVARNTATGLQRGVLTDAQGRYAIPLLPPGGPYTVSVTSVGFANAEQSGFNLSAGDVRTVNFTMAVQAVQLAGIEVSGITARLDVSQGGVVQRVGQIQIESLPVNGRDFTDFLNLSALVSPQPEVTTGGQFAIGGARTSGTNIQVDGADANNIFFGENRGSSRTPFAFSLESIKEFQLITNGFDVEYGNYQGGVVNAVTKSGTNDFQGSAFFYHRDERITAKDFNGLDPIDFRAEQFGLSLSGPIKRDKAHFFFSLDGQDRDNPLFAATPTAAQITPEGQQRIITALQTRYGLQNASRFFGQFKETDDNLVLFGRVDWNLGNDHRVTLRQNYSDFEQLNDRVNATEAITGGGPFRDKVYSTVAELNSVFGAKAFNTLRLQYSYEDRPRDSHPDGGYLPQIQIRGVPGVPTGTRTINFGGDGIIFRNRLQETKLQLIDNLSYRTGRHTLKLGTNNMLYNTKNEFWLLGNGQYIFNSLAAFEANQPTSYSRNLRRCPAALTPNSAGEAVICPQADVPFAEFNVFEWSGYAQDDWQLSDNLLVTGGVRVGGTNLRERPDASPALQAAFGVPSDVVPSFTGVSPRLSFTYDFTGRQEQLLRGGMGLLVGRAPTVIAGNAFQTERPLLSVFCSGTTIPTLDLGQLIAAPRGENNPSACRSGADPTGRPEYTIFSEDFDLPATLKANIGYEHVLRATNTKLGIDFIFSDTRNNFMIQDLNLKDVQFRLANEKSSPGSAGRPVYVPMRNAGGVLTYTPRNNAGADRLRNASFDRIFYNVSESEARAFNIALELDQRISDRVNLGVRYAYNRAYDNSTFSCCTSGEGFG